MHVSVIPAHPVVSGFAVQGAHHWGLLLCNMLLISGASQLYWNTGCKEKWSIRVLQ